MRAVTQRKSTCCRPKPDEVDYFFAKTYKPLKEIMHEILSWSGGFFEVLLLVEWVVVIIRVYDGACRHPAHPVLLDIPTHPHTSHPSSTPSSCKQLRKQSSKQDRGMQLSWEEEKKGGEVSMMRALYTCDGDLASVVGCLVGALDLTCHA